MALTKQNHKLTISASPHAHGITTTRGVMRHVLIGLTPALIGSVYFFGFRALAVCLVSMAACFLFEKLWCVILHKDDKTYDLSALVTGLLLAYTCPPTVPYWQLVIADAFAILLVKMLFGGIGKNVFNPALAGRAFLFSWPVSMSTWVKVGWENRAGIFSAADAVTAATPLAAMHRYEMPAEGLWDMFIGNIGGCIGETSAVLILIGFAWLLITKVITPRIPLCYIGTVALLTFLFPMGNDRLLWMTSQVLSGGLVLGAAFMATDYVTSPVTKAGPELYGVLCGVLTVVIRSFGGYNEGVSYAILIMNACVMLLDRVGRPKKFGTPGKKVTGK